MSASCVLRVAVFAPLRTTFDYLCPPDLIPSTQVGARVFVPFGHGQRLGIVLEIPQESAVPPSRLKPITRLLDETPLLDEVQLRLGLWVADYYHHPIGEVFETLLPTKLRRIDTSLNPAPMALTLTPRGRNVLESQGKLGPRQRQMLRLCLDRPLAREQLPHLDFDAGRIVRELLKREWLCEEQLVTPVGQIAVRAPFLTLNALQQSAYDAIATSSAGYRTHLLHGITGSGKTEVYLYLIRDIVAAGGQALVLVPEIGLTEQLVARFRERFGAAVAVLHSGLSEQARAITFQACRAKSVQVLLGTRSAVWMPLPALGLVVVDEEHDLSFKQQDGLRYSARDVAIVRAHQTNVPIVLGSATPSLESLANCERKKYTYIELNERAGGAQLPAIKLIDIRGQPLTAGVSEPLRAEIDAALQRGEQALVFLNRRGYAPVVLCHHCGWIANCDRCDARLVLHKRAREFRCHHCGAARSLATKFVAHQCGMLSDYVELGVGTEQIEDTLAEWFPTRTIVRIDRDTMPRRGQLERALAQVLARDVDILVGTQMISKGHDFAGVTLVGVIDADSRLLANDFRAEERFIQLVMQVAGRAGRATQPGLVLIQTHQPHHPIFAFIASGRYADFARHALHERRVAELPPYHSLALLRAEASQRTLPMQFLREIAAGVRNHTDLTVTLSGPVPALMERRIGKFRANLLLSAPERGQLARAITQIFVIIANASTTKRVRWTLDIDPQEIL
jgi:primosomal protein N' (replication factor Y) (superfamily II helicase)